MKNLQIIKSNKGKEKLCYLGYQYTKQIEKNGYIRWRCSLRSQNCKGIIKTTQKDLPRVLIQHNHPPNEALIEVLVCRSAMKAAANTGREKPSQIFARSVCTLSTAARNNLPSEDICKRTIRNQKSADFPPEPKRLNELEIPDFWKNAQGERFLLFDNGQNANSRIITFATDEGLRLLCDAPTWMMDGNFQMAPKQFMQLYIIRVPFGDITVSTVYCFLQKKSQETYEELFQNIIERCHDKNLSPDPAKIILDFEIAVFNSIKSCFGQEVSMQGCFFHLTQSTYRKIQDLGLTAEYKSDEEFRIFCGMLNALAFLPISDVNDGMRELRAIVPPGAEELVEYFDRTYVSGGYRHTRMNGINLVLRRTRPLFAPCQWNVHEATLNNDPRTNNQCEGWNNKFRHLVGHKHPSIWKAIQALQEEAATVKVQIAQHSVGNVPRKKNKRVYINLQERLKNLCQRYNNGNQTIIQFLRSVAHNIQLVNY